MLCILAPYEVLLFFMLIYCHRTIVEAITAPLKQQKPIDLEKIYSLIPQFKMYPGWSDLLKWLKDNNIRFAVVSQSTKGILSRTFKHFGIEPEYVGCFDLFHRKPHIRNLQKALEKLGLQPDTIDHPMELIKYLQ